jgi:glycerate-2-kinase
VVNVIIKNFAELSTTELRKSALELVNAGISAVLPEKLMKDQVKFEVDNKILTIGEARFDLFSRRLFVVGGGKAAGRMAEVLESIIPPEDITAGVVNCNSSDYSTKTIEIIETSHPLPDEMGVDGVKRMLDFKDKYDIDQADIILFLLSGGGSALLPYPIPEITLDDKIETTEILLTCGADISEINTVRKHISMVKGGRFGLHFSPATVISLIISDVIGNKLDAIASGPTVPDGTTFKDAISVIEKYNLNSKVPSGVEKYLQENIKNPQRETPKQLENCQNLIIGDVELALNAVMKKAKEIGLKPKLITCSQKGEPEKVAQERIEEILNGKYTGFDALLLGGETTPILPEDHGFGGRNQQYGLSSIPRMTEYPGTWVLTSVSTDGADFQADYAGVIIDDETTKTTKKKDLDVESFIKRFDSNTFFKILGNSLIETGDTGTNVGDLIIYILG